MASEENNGMNRSRDPKAKRGERSDKEYLDDMLDAVKEHSVDEEHGAKDLCDSRNLLDFTPKDGSQQPDYTDPLAQARYIYRFHLAYTYEYMWMFRDILEDIDKRREMCREVKPTLHVLSLGSGAGPDYRGLLYARRCVDWPAKRHLSVTWTGVDLVDWKKEYRVDRYRWDKVDYQMPVDMVDYLCGRKAEDGEPAEDPADISDVDIVVFPKSIYELDIDTVIDPVAKAFREGGPDRFYLAIVPPTGRRKEEETKARDNKANWLHKSEMQKTTGALLEKLERSYEVVKLEYEGVRHDDPSKVILDEFRKIAPEHGGEKYMLEKEGDLFPANARDWDKEFTGLHRLCRSDDGCAEIDSPDGCKFCRHPIKNGGYLGYEVYLCTRKPAAGSQSAADLDADIPF